METRSHAYNAIVKFLAHPDTNGSDGQKSRFILTYPVLRIMKFVEYLNSEQLAELNEHVSKLLAYYISLLSKFHGLSEKESPEQEGEIENIRYASATFTNITRTNQTTELLGNTATFSTPSENVKVGLYSTPVEGYLPQGSLSHPTTIEGFVGTGESLSFTMSDTPIGGANRIFPAPEPELQTVKPKRVDVELNPKLLRERDFTAKLKKLPQPSSYSAYRGRRMYATDHVHHDLNVFICWALTHLSYLNPTQYVISNTYDFLQVRKMICKPQVVHVAQLCILPVQQNNLEDVVFEVLRAIKKRDIEKKGQQPFEDMTLEEVRKQTEEPEKSLSRQQLATTTIVDTSKHDSHYQVAPNFPNVSLGLEELTSSINQTLNIADSPLVEPRLNPPEGASRFFAEKPCLDANEEITMTNQEMRDWAGILRQLESVDYNIRHFTKKRKSKRRKISVQKPDQVEFLEVGHNIISEPRQVTDVQQISIDCNTYITRLHCSEQLGAEEREFLRQLIANVSPIFIKADFSNKSRYQIVKQIRVIIELCSKSIIKIEPQRDGNLAINLNKQTK